MYDVSTNSTPRNIRQLFIHSSDVHAHNTCSSSTKKFYIQESRLCGNVNLSLRLVPDCGTVYTSSSLRPGFEGCSENMNDPLYLRFVCLKTG